MDAAEDAEASPAGDVQGTINSRARGQTACGDIWIFCAQAVDTLGQLNFVHSLLGARQGFQLQPISDGHFRQLDLQQGLQRLVL